MHGRILPGCGHALDYKGEYMFNVDQQQLIKSTITDSLAMVIHTTAKATALNDILLIIDAETAKAEDRAILRAVTNGRKRG